MLENLAYQDPGYGPRSQQERMGRAEPLVLHLKSQSFPYVCPFQLFEFCPKMHMVLEVLEFA